jgi:DNA-binding transcriptional ArsR family regulator
MAHSVHGQAHVGELDAATAREVAETMQALATPSRVRILGRLRHSPCSVGELADAVAMERSAVSQQQRVLRHLGLVVGERRGRSII